VVETKLKADSRHSADIADDLDRFFPFGLPAEHRQALFSAYALQPIAATFTRAVLCSFQTCLNRSSTFSALFLIELTPPLGHFLRER